MRDLWPDDFGKLDQTPPVVILREQAELLSKKTRGAVVGNVVTGRFQGGSTFEHAFFVVAPSLENYSYNLFSVAHPIQFYPLTIAIDGETLPVANQDQFLDALREILSRDKTRQIINAIKSQVETDQTVPQGR